MIEKKNQENVSKMMIAFYQRPYSDESVEKIKQLLDSKRPDELLLLSITEQRKSSGTIGSYLGRKDVEKLKGHFEKDQEIRSNQYANRILNISKQKGITTKKTVEKGNIFEIIKSQMKQYNPDIVIINHSDKSKMDKLITGCVEDEVVEKCENNIIVV